MNPYLELIRPRDAIMAALAALLGFSASMGSLTLTTDAVLAALTVFLISGAGHTVNDYYDREIDKKKHKKKPIPGKRISAQRAHLYSIFLFAAGIATSIYINLLATIVAITFSILLYLYSAKIHKQKYIGNIIVSLSVAFAFIYGGIAHGNLIPAAMISIPPLLANMAREITKDLEDKKVDLGFKKSLPMLIGDKNASHAVMAYSLLAIAAGFYVIRFFSDAYAPFLLLGTGIFGHASMLNYKKKHKASQKEFVIGMIIVLLGYAAGLAVNPADLNLGY